MADHVWELRNPDGAMTGMPWGRSLIAEASTVLAHSLPERVDVEVRTTSGERVAIGEGLEDPEHSTPMARLEIRDGRVTRRNAWPGEEDVGLVVLLPGGEAGILLEWWNEADHSAWRWRLELSNSR